MPKGLLISAIRDPNPVLYFEHKFLYRRIKATLPEGDWVVPIGKADVKRTGSDISVITYGAMVHVALEAAEVLAKDGNRVGGVGSATFMPLDKEAIYESVAKPARRSCCTRTTRPAASGRKSAALLARSVSTISTGRFSASRRRILRCRSARRWRNSFCPKWRHRDGQRRSWRRINSRAAGGSGVR